MNYKIIPNSEPVSPTSFLKGEMSFEELTRLIDGRIFYLLLQTFDRPEFEGVDFKELGKTARADIKEWLDSFIEEE